MANMIVEDGKFKLPLEISAAGTETNTLNTENQFVDKNIEIITTTPAGVLGSGTGSVEASSTATGLLGNASSSAPQSGYYLTVGGEANVAVTTGGFIDAGDDVDVNLDDVFYPVNEGTQTISGGGLSTTASSTALTSNGLSDGTTVDATKKVSLSTTAAANTYEVETSGAATVARAAVTSQVTTAGYFAAEGSAQTAIAAGTENVSNTHSKYYIPQSTLSASSVTPSTSAQTVTIGPGYYHENRTVTVAALGSGAATSSFSNSGLSTYFNAGSSSSNDVTITPQHQVTTAGFMDADTNPVDGTPSYYSIKTTSITEGTTTVSGDTATRGTASWGTGWIAANSISAATFANSGTSGVSYVDISATTSAPTLVSNDYLYINSGYTDNLKISLAKLVPDGSNIQGHADKILNGYTAYDNDGKLVTGTIQTYDGTYTVS